MPAVVFVTAFDRYALRAFEVHAMDYLTKLVHPDRLAQTVARLQRVLSQPNAGAAASPALVPHLVPETPLEAADLVRLQDGRRRPCGACSLATFSDIERRPDCRLCFILPSARRGDRKVPVRMAHS